MTTLDEIQVAEALLLLSLSQTKATTATSGSGHRPACIGVGLNPRWGRKRRRSVPKSEEEKKKKKKAAVERLSPSTPLSFSPSGGDETPPRPPPPLLPRPPPMTAKIAKKVDPHKEWVKEQQERISSLSATKASLQQCVLDAKNRYQILIETNSWLKELQIKTMIQKQKQQQQPMQLNNNNGSKSELDLFPVGPARLVEHHHHHHRRRQLDLNRSLDEETAAAEWRRQQLHRAAAYAQARKRRIELRRVKSSLKIQRLR